MYQGLGFDPTPGELTAVTETITQLTAAADALADVQPALRRAAELSQPWQGNAADTFRARLRDVRPSQLESRLRQAASTLDGWADTLTANQRRAEQLDVRALRLRKRLDTAWDLLQDKQNARDLAATAAAAAQAAIDVSSASTLVADLEAELDGVLAEARTLETEHLAAADAVADELAGAEIPRPAKDSALGRMAGAALSMASGTASALGGLLLPAGAMTVPTGAAAALAAALSAGERS